MSIDNKEINVFSKMPEEGQRERALRLIQKNADAIIRMRDICRNLKGREFNKLKSSRVLGIALNKLDDIAQYAKLEIGEKAIFDNLSTKLGEQESHTSTFVSFDIQLKKAADDLFDALEKAGVNIDMEDVSVLD